jgi:hypothetical protein
MTTQRTPADPISIGYPPDRFRLLLKFFRTESRDTETLHEVSNAPRSCGKGGSVYRPRRLFTLAAGITLPKGNK